MQYSIKKRAFNEKRQHFKKEAKRKNKKRNKTHNKKHGKNMQNGAIKPQKREKKLQKANIPDKNTGFCRNILKKQSWNHEKISGKKLYEVKACKSGQKTLEYAQKCLIKLQSDLISTKKHLKSAVNYYESHLKARLRGKYSPKCFTLLLKKQKNRSFEAQNSLVA